MRMRAVLIGIATVVAAMFAASTANATSTMTINPGGTVSASGTNLTMSNSIVSVFCDHTMTMSIFTRVALNLSPGGLTRIGSVTSRTATSCDGVEGRLFLNLPWDLTVELPLPTGPGGIANLVILNAQIEVLVSNDVRCLYQGDLRATLADTNSNGAGDTLQFDPARNQIPLVSSTTILCELGGDLSFEGSLSVAPELTVILS